jgi:trigger factor
MQGLTLENYMQYTNDTIENLRERYQEDAKKSVKEQLVLEAIAKEEGLQVEDSDLEEEFKRLAETYKKEPQEIKEQLEKQGQIEAVKHSIIIDKTIQFLLDNAKIN